MRDDGLHEPIERPPLGLVPKRVRDSLRRTEILEAMRRYAEAEKPVPVEWVYELRDLVAGGQA